MLYDRIKEAVTMRDALAQYVPGYAGKPRIPCPIHNGTHNNFAYNKRGFRCFSCGAHGTVIDFVMQYFGIGLQQAAVRLDSDFHLGLIGSTPRPDDISKLIQEKRKAEQEQSRYRQEYDEKCREHQKMWEALQLCKPASPSDNPSLAFSIIHDRLIYLEHWFETHEWK